MASLLKVRRVGASKHKTSEYLITPIYLPGQNTSGEEVLACFRRELYLVDDLRAKILLGNDILGPEGVVVDVADHKAFIGSCQVIVPLSARQRGQFIRKNVHTKMASVIPPHSEILVPTKTISLPNDRDFFFEPYSQANLVLYVHLVDY